MVIMDGQEATDTTKNINLTSIIIKTMIQEEVPRVGLRDMARGMMMSIMEVPTLILAVMINMVENGKLFKESGGILTNGGITK